jgi:mycofactocin glycosyltransferase
MNRGHEHSQPQAKKESLNSSANGLAAALPYPAHLACMGGVGLVEHRGADGQPVFLAGSPLRLIRLRDRSLTVFQSLLGGASVAHAAAEASTTLRSAGVLARRFLDAGVLQPLPSTNEIAHSQVTLVIPTHNRAPQLERLLQSLGTLINELAEVIVVDDGSTDHTSDILRAYDVREIHHASAGGAAAARNAGIRSVTSEYVLCLDSDCAVGSYSVTGGESVGGDHSVHRDQDWLPLLLQQFCDPAVALVAPRIVPFDASSSTAVGRYEAVRSSLDLGPRPAYVIPRTPVAYVPAAAFVAEVAALYAIGLFDETLNVGEDVDLVWRLHQSGKRVRYEPAAKVAHDHRTSWKSYARRRFDYGTSAAVLDAKHRGQVAPLAVSKWSALAWAGAAIATPASVATAAAIVATTTALLPRKLQALKHPWKAAFQLAGRGHLGAGRQIGSSLWRAYLPLVLTLTPFSKTARRALAASAIVPNLFDWHEKKPCLDPIRYVGIRLLDDASYCAGTWAGVWRVRSLRALTPDFASWPGRTPAGTSAKTTPQDAAQTSAATEPRNGQEAE